MATIWIIGPISMDTFVYLNKFPSSGSYTKASNWGRRVGGTATNTACNLSLHTDITPSLVSYISNDQEGLEIAKYVADRGIDISFVASEDIPCPQVVLFVDGNGERTIVDLNPFATDLVKDSWLTKIADDDVVFFSQMAPPFRRMSETAKLAGATVCSALPQSDHLSYPVDIFIDSESALPSANPSPDLLHGLSTHDTDLILTRASAPVSYFQKGNRKDYPVSPISVCDATGAGDAFAAGVLTALYRGNGVPAGIETGIEYAQKVIQHFASHPVS